MILFQDPTRWKHFVLAIPIGLVFTILCVLGVATGMEFKDRQWGGLWDWKDWLCSTASDHPHLFVKSIE